MHAYATLCIAKAAGYSDDDALLLAWADIETDCALQCRWHNPHRWSYYGTRFHFWPDDPKTLICRPDSELSRLILAYAEEPMDALMRHIRVGIALHGLQDSYFHQNWCGKFSRHNVLPAWSKERLTLSIPFPYGHSPLGKMPDVANAVWYDPRTGETIKNRERAFDAITATGKVLGVTEMPKIYQIFADVDEYDVRKQRLRDLAGMPDLKFSAIRKAMFKKYKEPFLAAAKAQAEIVKEYLK